MSKGNSSCTYPAKVKGKRKGHSSRYHNSALGAMQVIENAAEDFREAILKMMKSDMNN